MHSHKLIALFAGVAVTLVTACAGGTAITAEEIAQLREEADLRAITQIEVDFHGAASAKDLDKMASLFADNATFTTGGETFSGRDQIREFFATKAGPFKDENHWISETPAYKLRNSVDGDAGTIYFECHYVDPATRTVVSVVGADATVARIDGKWVMTTLTASALPELVP